MRFGSIAAAVCLLATSAAAQGVVNVQANTMTSHSFDQASARDNQGRRIKEFSFQSKAGEDVSITVSSELDAGVKLVEPKNGKETVLAESKPGSSGVTELNRVFASAGTYKFIVYSSVDQDQRFVLSVYDGLPPPPPILRRPPRP